MIGTHLTILGISFLYIFLSVFINEENSKYLLSGYNTMSDLEREKFDIKEYLKFFKPFFYNLAIYSLLIFYLCFFIFGVSVAIWLWMFFQGLRFFQLINKQNSFVSKS